MSLSLPQRRRWRAWRLAQLVLVAFIVSAGLVAFSAPSPAACDGAAASAGSPAPPPPTSADDGVTAPSAAVKRVSKLLVIVLENHSQAQALSQMPQLKQQADRYGVADNWYAVAHPSLPNYLELVAGGTLGVKDDRSPDQHRCQGTSVFGQLTAKGHAAATYAEGMPVPCAQTNSGSYAVKHNPWAYFVSARERAACHRFDVPAGSSTKGQLHDAVVAGRLPTYSLLIPDICNDGHNCPLRVTDRWLHQWMQTIEAGPDFRSGRLAVVVTFDEDDHHAANHVLTVVAAAQLRHKVVSTRFTHASLVAAPSRLVGLPPLGNGAGSPDVLQAFGLR